MKYVRAAKSVIRRHDGKYLVLRCSEWPERPDRSLKPDLAGGMIEDGETPEAGVAREVQEETGLVIDSSAFELGYAHSQLYEEDGEQAAIIRLIYVAEIEGDPEITLSYEHDTHWWVSLDDMLAMDWRPFYTDTFAFLKKSGLLQ